MKLNEKATLDITAYVISMFLVIDAHLANIPLIVTTVTALGKLTIMATLDAVLQEPISSGVQS
jgi:uncharacterized membrane-anchored protein YitT (DUF2179 family)